MIEEEMNAGGSKESFIMNGEIDIDNSD